MPYVEINKESRSYNITTNDIRQTFVYIICDEHLDSNSGTFGSFFSPNDDVGLALFVYNTFPLYRTFPINATDNIALLLSEHNADDLGNNKWKVTLTYSISAGDLSSPGYVQYSVSIGGETIHKEKSLGITSAASRIGITTLPPETYGLVGITKNSIEGYDDIAKGFKFSITDYFSPTLWDSSLFLIWYALQGGVNNATFHGFAAGEVRFLDVSAQGELYKRIPVTFNFLASPNIAGALDPPFDPLFAFGHEIIDYLHTPGVDANSPILVPTYRFTHTRAPFVNFALFGI